MSDDHSTTPGRSNDKPRLWAEHSDILQARAITAEYAERVGLYSVTFPRKDKWEEKLRKLGVEPRYKGLPHYAGTTGIAIPYPAALDKIERIRIRVDKTTVYSDDGMSSHEIPRYLAQAGVRVVPYWTPEALDAAADTSIPLYVTEAPLKAISLTCHGYASLGLGGVLAGCHDPKELREHEEIVATKEMKRVNWKGRKTFIVFDAGVSNNVMVALGASYVWKALAQEGADVWLVRIPYRHSTEVEIEKGEFFTEHDQGPDDFISRNGEMAFQELVDEAVPADPNKRIALAIKGINLRAARSEAAAPLLDDLFFQACLNVGGDRALDMAAAIAKSCDISRAALKGAVTTFSEKLSARAKEEGPEWKSELRTTSSGVVKPVAYNVEIALRHDSKLKGLVAYDEFKQCVIFRTAPPWADVYPDAKNTKVGDPWSDADDTRLSGYLTRAHDIVDLPEKKVQAALTVVGMDHRFHPVREYLRGLTWDGVPRLDSMMETYFAADPLLREYHRIVSRVWMISAAARVERPGCKADLMLVLEGDQAVKKTSAFKVLGGEWYSDATQDDLQNKEAAMKLQGSWIFVFDEGSILTKADARHLKEFVTKDEDEIVPKYSNRKILLKRQCVLGLTTNDQQYLSDPTGNRRYLPVTCGVTSPKIDLDGLRRDRDQLWAEAHARFQQGEQWWPTDEEEKLLAIEQDKRRRADTWEPLIAAGLQTRLLKETTIEDVLSDILEIKVKDADHSDRIRVSNALKVLGWKLDIRKVNGVTKRVYLGPDHAGPLVATRTLSTAQEEAVGAFQKAIPVVMSLERLPSGRVVRVWHEVEPMAGDASDSMIDPYDV
ncbi:VapE domain-containing protein [Sorangium sp. So ce281]|uniref:VapE domain-containing protein n=1 Tax=unclassified Sorangium TaxID=2621164 RepID=UPI003F5E92C3